MSEWTTTAAWRELLNGLAEMDASFLGGDRAVADERSVVDGYRMLATAVAVALDVYLYGDPERPIFVDANTPYRRDRAWGGDNTDAWYAFTPISPTKTYRVTGNRGDSAYFSLTVYNQPEPGQWSNRIVGIVNDTDLEIAPDGAFSFMLGPAKPDGYEGAFIELAADTHLAFTRDYQLDPLRGQRVTWEIAAVDEPGPIDRTDVDTAAALKAALQWVRTLFAIVPMTIAPREASPETLGHNVPVLANQFADPYQVQDANFGWSARDACYAFASFVINADEALVITHRPPECRFWNLVIWNPFMATEALTDARTSLNNGSAELNSDGTVTVVVARDQLAHPNALTTAGQLQGALAFRWFLADKVPATPVVEVVKVADLP